MSRRYTEEYVAWYKKQFHIGDIVIWNTHIGEILDISFNRRTAYVGFGGHIPDEERIPTKELTKYRCGHGIDHIEEELEYRD